eukprot:4363649-Lingulodinium_polyedra.AAC.1
MEDALLAAAPGGRSTAAPAALRLPGPAAWPAAMASAGGTARAQGLERPGQPLREVGLECPLHLPALTLP